MVVSEPLKIDPASFSELKCLFQRMSEKETVYLPCIAYIEMMVQGKM